MEVFAIRSGEDHERALEEIDALLDVKSPSEAQSDRLLVLTTLVEAYKEEHQPILAPNTIEAIRFRLDQLGFSTPVAQTKVLAALLGSRSRVSEILHRKRGLSSQMVLKLWRRFDIPLESLVRGMSVRRKKPRRRDRAIRKSRSAPD